MIPKIEREMHMSEKNDVLAGIGNTSLIRLKYLPEKGCADVWVKWEGANPTGSMKDRMALSIIEGAEKRGELKPGGRVVEYTGGSTGSSLSMVCAAKGYGAYMVSSDAFSEEKIRTMRAFGAEVEIVPSGTGKITRELIDAMRSRAEGLATEANTFYADQFNNQDHKKAYYKMGEEILEQSDGACDAFVMMAGTGGCFSGVAEVLKGNSTDVKCFAGEPDAHRNISGGAMGGHRIEGVGIGFLPKIMRMDLVDEVVSVKDDDAYETARALAREEGILGGISSGANVFAALQLARELGPGKRVVTVIVDSGLKYFQKDLFTN